MQIARDVFINKFLLTTSRARCEFIGRILLNRTIRRIDVALKYKLEFLFQYDMTVSFAGSELKAAVSSLLSNRYSSQRREENMETER